MSILHCTNILGWHTCRFCNLKYIFLHKSPFRWFHNLDCIGIHVILSRFRWYKSQNNVISLLNPHQARKYFRHSIRTLKLYFWYYFVSQYYISVIFMTQKKFCEIFWRADIISQNWSRETNRYHTDKLLDSHIFHLDILNCRLVHKIPNYFDSRWSIGRY